MYVPAEPRRSPVRPRGAGPLRTPHATEAHRTTSHSGPCINRSDLLGTDYEGDAFVCEPSHTVVLRRKLEASGSTFVASDPTPEASTEWLAAEDNWFRPTQIRSGPDGALWLVDMYRMIIEHTKWLPADQKKTMNVRAGDASGRIYRIYPRGKRPALLPDLTKMSGDELGQHMESPHGTLRDLVQQEIVMRQSSDAAAALRGRTIYSKRPAVRVQARWTLNALNEIVYNDFALGIKDPAANVRAQTARMMEQSKHPGVLKLLLDALEAENDAQAAQQMACSLGTWNHDPAVPKALEAVIHRFPNNHFLRAAARSSMPHDLAGPSAIIWKIEPRDISNPKRSALVEAIRTTLPKHGEVSAGRLIFEAQCMVCHAVDGKGHPIGPDLTALSNHSDAFLLESILDPQRAIDPDYVAISLQTLDGKTHTGVMKDATGNAFTLRTADGATHEILRTQVKQITNLNRSIMPETFEQTIPGPQQMRDLISYLQQLK